MGISEEGNVWHGQDEDAEVSYSLSSADDEDDEQPEKHGDDH